MSNLNLKQILHGAYKSAAESILPPLQKSAFEEKGVLTPNEFILAGDFLIRSCPSWQWNSSADPRKAKSYLPPNKQYLITRNVPCFRRASALASYGDLDEVVVETNDDDTEGWVTAQPSTSTTNNDNADDGFEHISSSSSSSSPPSQPPTSTTATTTSIPDLSSSSLSAPTTQQQQMEEDIPDIGDLNLLDDASDEDDDEAVFHPIKTTSISTTAASAAADATINDKDIIKTRRYDLLITYDKYYQVPRFWLIGYDEEGCPLPPHAVLEDVSAEHARKTVTVEPHPFAGDSSSTTTTTRGGGGVASVVSIHPCRHAEVMHKLAGVVGGKDGTFQIEHYLLLFTKFIASVIPTIQYDFTMAAGKAKSTNN
jgi:ubiquitin-like-conjugating enzyme ATG3